MTDGVWRIELLGWIRASRDGVSHTAFSQKSASLLAFLALSGRPSHTREELAAMLWPDVEGAAGRHNLRTRIYELRRSLEPPGTAKRPVLEATRDAVRLVPGTFTTDVAEFRAAVTASAAGGGDAGSAMQRAVDAYRGELLPGCYDAWIQPERRRLESQYADVLERRLEALIAGGDRRLAIDLAHRLIALDPLNEAAQIALIRLHRSDGDPVAALAQFRAYAVVLRDELGVAPSPELQALAREIRRQSADHRPSGSERLEVAAPPRGPADVPEPLTRFVGREAELARLHAALVEEGARLVTIAGPGGIGKSRLAAEFARRARQHGVARVVYADVADLDDDRFVVEAIAAAAGAPDGTAGTAIDALAALAGDTRAIVLLDNAERVAAGVAEAARHVLARAPGLGVLVTSRRALAVAGEVEVRLGPLPTPAGWDHPSELEQNPSVAMYVDRARARHPEFALTRSNAAAVARLCAQLEGIPLALELAAVRERVLPAVQMLPRLAKRFDVLVGGRRDVPERHRTLAAAIDWSYRALDEGARRVFARLSVFRGGWALDEAEALCAVPDTAGALDRLCDVSLVEAFDRDGVRRFRMLETIREFALEQVVADERAALRRHHARLFFALAERAHVYLLGPEQDAWYRRVDAEFENIRAAVDWALGEGDAVAVTRIFVDLYRYWPARSRRREARRWLSIALERGADRLPRRLHARALRYAGELALGDGDLTEAKRRFEQAMATAGDGEDPYNEGFTLSGLGHIAARRDAFDEARDLLHRGLAVAKVSGSPELIASLANDLGVLDARTRNVEGALGHFSESLGIYREIGDETSVITLLFNLGYLATIACQFDRAEAWLTESVATSRRLGHALGLASATAFLGLLELRRGNHERAARVCRDAIESCLEAGESHRLVLAVEGLGLALASTDPGRALEVLGHAAALREATELEPVFEDPDLVTRTVAALEAAAGAAEGARRFDAGRAASTEAILGEGADGAGSRE